MPTLLVHSSLDQIEIDEVIGAVTSNVKVSKHDGFITNADVDNFFKSNYKVGDPTIGLLYHNPEDDTIPFFKDTDLKDIKGVMTYFLTKCKQNNVKTLDLITCNINDTLIQIGLASMYHDYGVDVRYSIDPTSDLTNWVMESHNVDIKPLYFSKDLDILRVLGLSGFNHHYTLTTNGKLAYTTNYAASQTKDGRVIMTLNQNYKSFDGRGAGYFAIDENNVLLKSGNNYYRELATGDNVMRFTPVNDNSFTFEQISTNAGDSIMAIIDDNGTKKAIAAGRNYYGSNGVNTTSGNRSTWEFCVDSTNNHITNVSQIQRGPRNSWILKNDGTVWGAGRADFHQLTGNGISQSNVFVQIQRKSGSTYSPLTGVSKLRANGGAHYGVCAVMNSGSVLIWGIGGTGKSAAIETTSAECGTREISIPNETIVDIYPYSYEYYHQLAYIKTASNKYYTVGQDQVPVEDTYLSPGSATIGGTGRHVVKILRMRDGFCALTDNGEVHYRGRFRYGELPYSNNYNLSWTKHPSYSGIIDIDTQAGSFGLKLINSNYEVIFVGNNARYDFPFDPFIWFELDFFQGKNIVQWADGENYVAILDDTGNVYIQTFYTPFGSYEQYTEYHIADNVKQIVGRRYKGIVMLKNDGTVYEFGHTSSAPVQWGDSYSDVIFTMVSGSEQAIYAIDADGNIYASESPGNYIDAYHPVQSGQTTIIRSYEEYKTEVETWAGFQAKVIGIYGTHKSLYLLLEGGYVIPLGYNGGQSIFGNNSTEWSPNYTKPVLGPDGQPLANIITINAATTSSKTSFYTTTSGKVYYSGYLYTPLNGNGSYNSRKTKLITSIQNPEFLILGRMGYGLLYKVNGLTYVSGHLQRIGAAKTPYEYGNNTSSTPVLLSERIGTDFDIADVNRNFVINGTSLTDNVASITSSYTGQGLKHKMKELILTNSRLFSNKSIALEGASVLDLFTGSFATEMQSSSRKVRMKLKTGNKYVLDSTDLTGLGNGDVLYIADEATSTGTDVVLNIGGTDYTYKLFTDKITYNSTDYAIGDSITFGTLNLVVKGLSSTEFIQEGTEPPAELPCFGPGTLIQTKNGLRPIETIQNGDLIWNAGRYEPVKVYKRTIHKTTERNVPYLIKKNALYLGVPSKDTVISMAHAIFNPKTQSYTFPVCLEKFGLNVHKLEPGQTQKYYNLETPNYLNSIMIANNMPVETYANKQLINQNLKAMYTPHIVSSTYPIHFKRNIVQNTQNVKH